MTMTKKSTRREKKVRSNKALIVHLLSGADRLALHSGQHPKDNYKPGPPNTYSQTQPSYQPYGYAPPPPNAQLPPGWIMQWDPNSRRHFFVEQATGRTQWEPPIWQ